MGNMSSGNFGFGLTFRKDLTNIVDHRKVPEDKFRYNADIIAPPIGVNERCANMPSFLAGEGERYITGDRAQDGTYPLLTSRMSEEYYATKARGWEMKQDEVDDIENNELFDMQIEQAGQLSDTSKVFREYRVAQAVEDDSKYAVGNKLDITAEANNWLKSDNMRDNIIAAVEGSTLFKERGLELEFLTLIMPITFIRKVIKLDKLVASAGLTNISYDLLPLEKKMELIKEFTGVGKLLGVSGRINTAHFEAEKPSFSRIWHENYAVLTYLSDGGGWGPGLARQPWSKKHLKGKRDYVESYALPENDQTRIRLKNFDGLFINYDYGFNFKGINYV
ncbi:MAG: hypothetical protein ACTSXT_13790 [Candidatus Helarchaeota archaeon]